MNTQPSVQTIDFKGVRVEVRTQLPLDDVIARLHALMGETNVSGIVALAQKVSSEEEYVQEVSKRFVGKSGFMLFSEIDHGSWIARFGIRRRTLRWILGNPLIAITMIRHDITAGLFAPVEVLLTELPETQGTEVVYVRPSSLMAIHGNDELLAAAQALDEKLDALIANATAA